MNRDMLDLYERASAWTLSNVKGAAGNGHAAKLDGVTPCDGWNVRQLMDHMLETQRYFVSSAKGMKASPPSSNPPSLLSEDPVSDFETGRRETLNVFGADDVIERTGPALGIAFADQLLHGWDLAKATGQDATMPDGLAEIALNTIHGRFTEEQRKGVFKPEIPVGANASAQDKLLAYTGRKPSS
jgi:uncharacterized protein (TIGR03086 family)